MATLFLDDVEDEIEEAQRQEDLIGEEVGFCLVGYFLTVNVIHYPTMRSTMANLWHTIKGVQILDLGEERFLFRFFS